MPIRPISRCPGLICQHRLLSTTRGQFHITEASPSSGPPERPRRSIDISKIWQAQGDNGKGKNIDSKIESTYDILDKCPDPQCPCAPTPTMPEDLPIDTISKMTMPYYDRHVLVGVQVELGTDPHALAEEWPSKIESNSEHPATILKAQLGPKGKHYRPDFAVSITASTLPNLDSADTKTKNAEEFWLFPDFARVRVRQEYTNAAGSARTGLTAIAKAISIPAPLQQQIDIENAWSYESITKPVVLICGHGSRDKRCGIMGPLLLSEFRKHVGATGDAAATAHVGLVSHIGGHKFAGNVIIYAPPIEGRTGSSICGKAVWYGRVEPRHVEGIVKETIKEGRVIGELLRGVHAFR